MGEQISKEELKTLLDTYKEVNTLFESISKTQEVVAEKQDRIMARLYNGMSKEIINELKEELGGCTEEILEKVNKIENSLINKEDEGSVASRLDSINSNASVGKGYAEKAAWFVGVVAILIVVVTTLSTVILRGIDNRKLFKEEIKEAMVECLRINK